MKENPMTKSAMKSLLKLCLLLILSLGAGGVRIYAQDATPSPTPESEETKRLKEEKEQAELRKAIAEARKAELEAKFPKPSTTPLEGKTTINDGAVIESEMVSYLSMAYAANRILSELKQAKDLTDPKQGLVINALAIYNEDDVKLLLNYNVTRNQLEIIRQEYCKLLASGTCPTSKGTSKLAPAAAIPLVSSFLGSFVDLTALLRTNVTIQGHTFNIDEAALVSEVFRAARATDGLTNHPALYYPAVFPPTIKRDSEILGLLESLHELRGKVEGLIGSLEENQKKIKKTESDIEDLEAKLEDIESRAEQAQAELNRLEKLKEQYGSHTPFEAVERIAKLQDMLKDLERDHKATQEKHDKKKNDHDQLIAEQKKLLSALDANLQHPDDLDDTIARLKTLNDQFDKFVASLVKNDESTGVNSLTAYIKAENLNSVLSDEHSYWLQLAVLKAGGNNRIKSNLVLDVFRGGNSVSHSGGSIVQFNLYDKTGRSIASDTFTEYTGYIKANKIKNLPNPVEVNDVPKRKTQHP